jgi:hypothetical protein
VNFTYKIEKISVHSTEHANNIVGELMFKIIGEKNGKTHSSFFPVQLEEPDLNSFTEFENLTEDIAINWALEIIGADQIAALKNGIESVLDSEPTTTVDGKPILKTIDMPWLS